MARGITRPAVNARPVASHHQGPTERILEISYPSGRGGLVSLRTLADGRDIVELYREDPGIAVMGPRTTPISETIYVLTLEIQGSEGEGGTVCGAYRTRAGAEAAQRAEVAQAHAAGRSVWGHPNPAIEDDDGEDPDWDYSYEIEAVAVKD